MHFKKQSVPKNSRQIPLWSSIPNGDIGKTTKQIWRSIEYYNRRQDGRRNRASNQRLPIVRGAFTLALGRDRAIISISEKEQDELLIVGILKKAST